MWREREDTTMRGQPASPARHNYRSTMGSRSAPSISRHARSSSRAAVCGTAIGPSPASAWVAEQAYAEPLALGGGAFSSWKWRSIGLVASPESGSAATSEEPPSNRAWPTPAGRLTRVTSLCRAGWLHLVERAKLALGGLRSAEPRLGEPWPPLGRAGEDRLGAAGGRRRSPSRLECRGAHLRERLGDRLGARCALFDERREAGLEAVAAGVDRR